MQPASGRKRTEEPYRITFSSGDVLSFTEEEVLEHGLYREGVPCRDYEEICTVVLAKRMMASAASYVLFSAKTEAPGKAAALRKNFRFQKLAKAGRTLPPRRLRKRSGV